MFAKLRLWIYSGHLSSLCRGKFKEKKMKGLEKLGGNISANLKSTYFVTFLRCNYDIRFTYPRFPWLAPVGLQLDSHSLLCRMRRDPELLC